MKNMFSKLKDVNSPRFSEEASVPNWGSVSVQVLNDEAVNFYEHESADKMFLVLSGTLFIDIKKENCDVQDSSNEFQAVRLKTGDSYTVGPGITHRERAIGRAELIVIGGGPKVN